MTAILTSPRSSSHRPSRQPFPNTRRWAAIVLLGVLLTLFGFGGFTTWASLAPLASAAVAPGIVTADTNRKTVQHLDGGVIAEIAVRDGDHVEARQVLMRLDDLETRSVVTLLEGQRRAYAAQEARLLAERDNRDKLVFPKDLADLRSLPEMAEILSGQERIFQSRRASLEGKVDVTRQRIAQYQAQIRAYEAQFNAGSQQLDLIREELVDVTELTAKGLERKPRLLALKRQAANLEGSQGEFQNNMAQAREAIAQAEMEILSVEADHQSEVATELREVQTRLAEVMEKLAAAQIRQGRRDVVAPEAGTVLNSRYFAPGAVVPPGGPILDLVPRDELAGGRSEGPPHRYRCRACRLVRQDHLQRLQKPHDPADRRQGDPRHGRRPEGRAHRRILLLARVCRRSRPSLKNSRMSNCKPACRRKP